MKPSTDIFLWANHTDSVKKNLSLELFFFNKNYTPYSVAVDESLDHSINPMTMYDAINYVTLGAGTGLVVRDYDSEPEANTLLRHDVSEVGLLSTLLHIIENERHDILNFDHDQHDFKRVIGIVAKYTELGKEPFYIIKQVQQSKAVGGATAVLSQNGKIQASSDGTMFKFPTDNQILVVDQDLFVFNQSKFESLFQYDYKTSKLAVEKGEIIDKRFKVNAAGTVGMGIEFLVAGTKSLHKRLAAIDPELMTLEQLQTTADDYQVELMFDDDGGVILMDATDAKAFLDLLEDNFVKGSIGKSYVANKKKELEL